ncbi:MAG: hypothetical protein ACE5IE_06705, partial [Dehalococcoidia bacterium]
RFAREATDTTAQAVFQYLAREENKHFVLLQRTHGYLATKGAWPWDDCTRPCSTVPEFALTSVGERLRTFANILAEEEK